MRKLFLKSVTLLFLLVMSVNAAWAQETSTIYLASLQAQSSPASTGSGRVKLTWLDITGKPMEVDLAKQMNYMAFGDVSFMSKDYVYAGPSATAVLEGATLIAMDGMEIPMEINGSGSQIYTTSFLYFHAEGFPDNGSYLAGWTFTDPAITRMTSDMNPADPMGNIVYTTEWSEEANEWVQVVDEGNSIPLRTPCFKVLPDKANSTEYPPTDGGVALNALAQTVGANPNNLYAVFKKYLLSNPTATSGQLDASEGETTTLSVSVDVEGDITQFKDNYADFVFPSLPGTAFSEDEYGTWSWNVASTPTEIISPTKIRAFVEVTYTAKAAITAGQHNTTITISMAGGEGASQLNIPLSVNALDPERPEAFLLDGKTEQASGTLAQMMAADISGYTNPILKLNKPVTTDLTFSGKNFTLDLNGNEAKALTISSGNVTIAYSKYGGSATSLTVNGGKAILNGGTFGSLIIGANGAVEQNGATITGAATNAGTLTTNEGVFNSGLTSSKTLTVNNGTFKGETAITVSGGTATLNRGTIEGTACGLKVTAGTAIVKKLAAIKGGTYSVLVDGGTINIESGKFDGVLSTGTTFTSGYFKDKAHAANVETGKEWMQLTNGVEYNEGYRFFLGDSETAQTNGVGVCRIGDVSYAKLEDAIAYANNKPNVENIVIFMTNNYTLPAGYYTLPANATIVVPMSDSQAKETNTTAPRVVFNDVQTTTPYVDIQPTEFRRLTFASGVNMNVFGQIEMTCSQYASNEAYTSQPVGPYGHLVLEEGSYLTLQSGSEVRAWGFVTGKGEMDARRGATVREMFQLGDWKGAMTSVAITGMVTSESPTLCSIVKSQGGVDNCDYSDKKIFPVTQYFIQNIESPVKYHPGAVLSTSAAVSEGLLGALSISMAATDIAIVGVSGTHQAIFLMDIAADADNTWVRKWYDAEHDIQVYDVNSAAHIGSMVLDMGKLALMGYSIPITLNSAEFDLPLTSNFKIHLLSGTMDFKQNTSLLPGAEVEVDKEATVSVAMDEAEKTAYDAWVAGGKVGDAPVSFTGALYVYDADEWDTYAYCNEYNGSSFVKSRAYTKTVRYAPSANNGTGGRPTVRDEQTKPADAAINVHGTFETATGFVYCSENGANIFSSNEDAGTFVFNESAEDAGERTVYNVKGVKTYESRTFYPAKLKNGNGEHVNTSEAQAGDAYCYINDEWTTMYPDEDNPCFMVEHNINGDTYYAKPQEYVAVAATKDNGEILGNADHTYSDAAGAGRLFILMDNCQWWEVKKKDNLYHCIHPNNDTYYYWDEDNGAWKEKTFTITWKNWDGTIVKTANADGVLEDSYEVTYGTMAEFLGSNPTREENIDYTYDFTGWTPALGPVTSNVTYTATYTQKPRKYTIIFCQEGGAEIERQFLTHNEIPVCENTPTRIGYTLAWNPAVAAVTGDATYTATWLENPPTEYEVKFYDYDGTTVLQQSSVAVGEMPEYTGAPPTGKATWAEEQDNKEFTYAFDHWSPTVEEVSATSIKSYTAVYREVAVKYDVRFEDEDGSEIETNQYAYGETPVCSATPTKKENTTQYTYSFAWTPQIQTVQGAATYRAVFTPTTNTYTVTLTSNLNGVCSFSGAGTFDYGATINNVAVTYNSEKYTFDGWSDGEKNAAHTSFTLTGDITLTANFTPKNLNDYTVAAGDTWTVPENTEVKDFILTSNGTNSGQLQNASNLSIRGEAIYRLVQTFDAANWYAVAVPWRVDIRTGVYAGSSRLKAGSQFYVIDFNANAYAGGSINTMDYWNFLHQTTNVMVPGKLYMIYLTSAQSSLDFHKDKGSSLITAKTSVSLTGGSGERANWNAIANPALFYATLNAGVEHNDAQRFVPSLAGEGSYLADNTESMIIGEPMFVQVTAASNVIAQPAGSGSGMPAYRRATQMETTDNRFFVELTHNNQLADRVIIQTAEEKADEYIIGKDIAKMGISSSVAQMWMERYNAKLCKNTVEPVAERAEYPLNIFAPVAGEYILSAVQQAGDASLYLTKNGEAIANLSDGAYTLDLQKGTTTIYGLRIGARVPQVATDLDAAIVDADGKTTKVLYHGQVFIIRGEKVYTVDGQLVK